MTSQRLVIILDNENERRETGRNKITFLKMGKHVKRMSRTHKGTQVINPDAPITLID